MLEEIRISGLGVIDDAELEFGPGFTAVTGETGAGKTMVLTGLNLLLGGRADPALVRSGESRALVEGRVRPPHDSPAADRAIEVGGELDDGSLILARTVSAEGRSRAFLGGRSVPASLLSELADDLVAVHGQSDQQRLRQPARQRAALDRFAGTPVLEPLSTYRAAYDRWRAVQSELQEITTRARERAQEADLLRFGLTEVEAVAPQPGEAGELALEEARLAHADALRVAAISAHTALAGEDPAAADEAADALSLVSAARRAVEAMRDHDHALADLADRLAECAYQLSDLATDLASYAAGVETDPVRLATVQDRRAALAGLTRKYGETIDEVLAWAEQASRRVLELDNDDDRIAKLEAERDQLRAELTRLASAVSQARHHAGAAFAAAVTAELAELAMPHARIEVAITRTPDPSGLLIDGEAVAFGPNGVDDVEIMLAPHADTPLRPLARGASGGELSRVMLAIEVVFAGSDPVPTMVFDEVDAGIGGKAAVEVGRRLARLARSTQVVVVTHLPQVAAFADHHLVVVKSDDGRVTRTGVECLDAPGRVRELSRMLAGLEGSATAEAHAEELLAIAAAAKAH